MIAAEVVIFLVAFGAILGAYALGQRSGRRDSELRRADGNVPPVEVLLEYRNAAGYKNISQNQGSAIRAKESRAVVFIHSLQQR